MIDGATGIVDGHGRITGSAVGSKKMQGTLWQGGSVLPLIVRRPGKIPLRRSG